MARPVRIGFLGFDGIEALDLFGPLECFAAARVEGVPAFHPVIVGLDGPSFTSESGVTIAAHAVTGDALDFDMVVVPGGAGLREPDRLERAAAWVVYQGGKGARTASVCTGVYALAQAGLLDGRRATTHWRFVDDVAARYPTVNLIPNAIFIQDGPVGTSAGITAGIDLALAIIEADCGPSVALEAARELVVYLKRPGGQAQFSDRLVLQTRAEGRLADLAAWMAANLDKDLSIDALAARTGLSRRHFTRVFRSVFDTPPSVLVETLRIDEARLRLETTRDSIGFIAARVGFDDPDAFSRVFERRYGMRPTAYRARFSGSSVHP